jgi:predicted permease
MPNSPDSGGLALFWDSIQTVLNIFILMGLGVVLSHRRWITADNLPLLSRLVVGLAVPCTIFNNMLAAVNRDSLNTAGRMLVVPALTVATMYALGLLLGRYAFRLRPNRRRTYAAMAACPNAIFIGLPLILTLFGTDGAPAAMFFIVCQTSTFWSVGSAGIQADAQGKAQFSLAGTLKRIFSVNVIVIIAVFLMAVADLQAPAMLTDLTRYIGALSTPLSLMFSGNALYQIFREYGLRGLSLQRDVLLVALARFIVAPLLAYAFCAAFGVAGLSRTVFVLMSAMPVMTQTVILTGTYGGDRDFAALSFFWSTVLAMVFIPLYLLLLG